VLCAYIQGGFCWQWQCVVGLLFCVATRRGDDFYDCRIQHEVSPRKASRSFSVSSHCMPGPHAAAEGRKDCGSSISHQLCHGVMTSGPGTDTASHASAGSPGSPASAGLPGSPASADSSGSHASAGSPSSPASTDLSGSRSPADSTGSRSSAGVTGSRASAGVAGPFLIPGFVPFDGVLLLEV
jgi:hypothetical protein